MAKVDATFTRIDSPDDLADKQYYLLLSHGEHGLGGADVASWSQARGEMVTYNRPRGIPISEVDTCYTIYRIEGMVLRPASRPCDPRFWDIRPRDLGLHSLFTGRRRLAVSTLSARRVDDATHVFQHDGPSPLLQQSFGPDAADALKEIRAFIEWDQHLEFDFYGRKDA